VTPQVTVFTDPRQNHLHVSSLYAGLDLLARRKVIRLTVRVVTSDEDGRLVSDPLTVCVKVTPPGQRSRLMAVDLHDQSDVFADNALELCDVYLKRSFERAHIGQLPPVAAAKLIPFGLNHPCRTRGSTVRFLWSTAPALIRAHRGWFQNIRYQVQLPLPHRYEQPPTVPLRARIVFQPRVWTDDEAPGEAQSINDRRVTLLRALRSTFTDRFVGGLVATRFALDRYPQDVSQHSSHRSRYLAMSKENLIGIYTQGLWGSNAFKLSEYLAASQCIVAEPPRGELPVPLKAGTHYLPFETLEQCMAACRRLLADHELATSMRRANHEYYLSSVEPSARMARVVRIAATAS
jgi:Glycosyl transferases group 1